METYTPGARESRRTVPGSGGRRGEQMTDFRGARIVRCHRCGARFVPEDGGCDCPEVEMGDDGEEIVNYNEDDPREDR